VLYSLPYTKKSSVILVEQFVIQGCAGRQNEHFSSVVSVSGGVGRADIPVCMKFWRAGGVGRVHG